MATNLTVNGVTYAYPDTGDQNWGTAASGWASAVTSGMLQKAGGTFTLTADVNFGGSFGLLSKYFTSVSSNPSTTGVVRFANNEGLGFRNAANNADLILKVNASNQLEFNGFVIEDSSGIVPVADGGTGIGSYTAGDTLYASGTTTLSKLAIGTANQVVTSTGTAPAWNLIVDANIDAAAAIAYSKLNLSTSIVNADISGSAAIAYSKLALTNSIVSGDLAGNVAVNKLVAQTASRAAVYDGSGFLTAATATTTEVNRLSGIGSSAVGISDSQVITNKDIDGGTASNTSRITLPKASLSTLSGLTRKQATLVYASDVNKVYKDDGSSLTEIGSASGSINYINNPDAEGGTTGWATYKDAAQSTPVDGTGGSPTLTFTVTSTTPLRGTQSFLITTTAANLQGEGASYDFTISRADQAKILSISFDYNIASGTYADGDMAVYIYDVTNSLLIQPAPYTILNLGSSYYGKFISTFQTSSNSTSYRLILHRAVSTASAMTMKLDNVVVGPQIVQYGAPVTDWKNDLTFTPDATAFGTCSNVDFWYRRVGGDMQVTGYFLGGTVTANPAMVALPSGYSIDTTRISGTAKREQVGTYVASDASTGTYGANNRIGVMHVDPAAPTKVYFGNGGGASAALINQSNASTIAANNNGYSVSFTVPILGWSSTVQMSNDSDTRVCAAIVSGDPASASSGNPIIVPTVSYDSHGAYNASTGRYTCPIPGIYKIYGALQSASSATTLTIYKNGSSSALAGNLDSNGEATFCAAVNCVAGDIIDLRPGGTVDATNMTLNIERLSGPSAIAATEKVYLQYTGNGGTSITANSTNVDFTTKVVDSHGAWSSNTTFTAPRAGFYLFNGIVKLTANVSTNVDLYKNTSSTLRSGPGVSTSLHMFSFGIYLVSGDAITIRMADNCTLSNSSTQHWISICSQG